MAADVPEWVLKRVDDAITEHFYKMEANISKQERKLQTQVESTAANLEQISKTLRQRMDKQVESTQHQQAKVHEVLSQLQLLIEAVTDEQRRGRDRDKKMQSMMELLEDDAPSDAAPPVVFQSETKSMSASTSTNLPCRSMSASTSTNLRRTRTSHYKSTTENTDAFEHRVNELEVETHQLHEHMEKVVQMFTILQARVIKCEGDALEQSQKLSLVGQKQHLMGVSASVYSLKALMIPEAKRHETLAQLVKKEAELKVGLDRLEKRIEGPTMKLAGATPAGSGPAHPDAALHGYGDPLTDVPMPAEKPKSWI